jgi:Tfp pilus assembly protein PilF
LRVNVAATIVWARVAEGRKIFMQSRIWRDALVMVVSSVFVFSAAVLVRSNALSGQEKTVISKKEAASANAAEAYRYNTLGVAYMNQQRPADAQKYFEQALAADPKFAVARLNLGVAFLGQQKPELARAALTEAAEQLPRDPYAWYNLGLAYKDLGEAEKGITAFQRVTEITQEADAYYFLGYLNTQLQKYDEAIAAFQKGLALYPYHASSEFGLARALQRNGDSAAAREHLARFQKITTEHLGAPFGAGYGDQGRYSLAELPRSSVVEVPAAIPVRYAPMSTAFVSMTAGNPTSAPGPSTGACFFDFDGDGRPDLFLVSGTAEGSSRLLHNLGDGRFADMTRGSGIELKGSGLGCAAGDFDNDGHTDLAVCLSDGVRLLQNKGDGKFEDVTEKVGIRREKGCVGVTFVDYDHDGDLDLYITMAADAAGAAPHNFLWRNNGNSTVTDV